MLSGAEVIFSQYTKQKLSIIKSIVFLLEGQLDHTVYRLNLVTEKLVSNLV